MAQEQGPGPNKPQPKRVVIEQVNAFRAQQQRNKQKPAPRLKNSTRVRINCPEHVLASFRALLVGSPILGTTFLNPYTNEEEAFPDDAAALTPRHLQLLARNEVYNTNGVMDTALYAGLLTDDQIATIRCLVKATNIAGAALAQSYGGFHLEKYDFQKTAPVIIVDQSGLQWQEDYRNTGGLFFYPTDPNAPALPPEYAQWQTQSYQAMYNQPRPSAPVKGIPVTWCIRFPREAQPKTPKRPAKPAVEAIFVEGQLDLDQVSNAIATEFQQALEAVALQGEIELAPDARINFKFLKAGMGFFASGLLLPKGQKSALSMARLEGIRRALYILTQLPPEQRHLGKVSRLVLPFSDELGADKLLGQIQTLTEQLGLVWGGVPEEDALAPCKGHVTATNNCGDPHALIGNEYGYQSVDAAIASNADVSLLNPGFNTTIDCTPKLLKDIASSPKQGQNMAGATPESAMEAPKPKEKKPSKKSDKKPVKKPNKKSGKKWLVFSIVLTILSGIAGVAFAGPIGLLAPAGVGLSCLLIGKLTDSKSKKTKTAAVKKESSKRPVAAASSQAPEPELQAPSPSQGKKPVSSSVRQEARAPSAEKSSTPKKRRKKK